MGLGLTGLADALIMCGLGYGTDTGRKTAAKWMAAIQNAAYQASAELAAEKGSFPLYDRKHMSRSPNVLRLSSGVRRALDKYGLRNGCLTSIAPTGTISLLAGNISSGIEPVFDFTFERSITGADGKHRQELVEDYALSRFKAKKGPETALPETFVKAADLSPRQHLLMQAALQPFVDSAISKTINCPEDIPFRNFKDIYEKAYSLGLKGCTTYCPSPVRGSVLKSIDRAARENAQNDERDKASEPKIQAQLSSSDPSTIVYMAKPLKRDPELSGITYKLKWPQSDYAIYVTINDIVRDGRRRPFEIFINTRNLEHYSWTVALTRMISAVFRRGGDVSFVAEELKAIFDPQGGCWVEGRYVPSLLAAIGEIIETHMRKIGFKSSDSPHEDQGEFTDLRQTQALEQTHGSISPNIVISPPGADRSHTQRHPRLCPRCASGHMIRRESCWACPACGFSQCD